MFFFFKQKTAYEMRISDWSSDVCSSDLFWIEGGRHVTRLTRSRVPRFCFVVVGEREPEPLPACSARPIGERLYDDNRLYRCRNEYSRYVPNCFANSTSPA